MCDQENKKEIIKSLPLGWKLSLVVEARYRLAWRIFSIILCLDCEQKSMTKREGEENVKKERRRRLTRSEPMKIKREKKGRLASNVSASGWPTFAYVFFSLFCMQVSKLPSSTSTFFTITHTRTQTHIKKGMCFYISLEALSPLSYLNQNGGQQKPGIESSFHLGLICIKERKENKNKWLIIW